MWAQLHPNDCKSVQESRAEAAGTQKGCLEPACPPGLHSLGVQWEASLGGRVGLAWCTIPLVKILEYEDTSRPGTQRWQSSQMTLERVATRPW